LDIKFSQHFTYGRLLRFAIPSIVMMLVTSVYTIVDGFFVSNFAGETAFAAVNLVIPILMLLGTTGIMFGTGGSAIVAITLGEGRRARANRRFSLFTATTAVTGILLSLCGFFLMEPIARFLGADGALLRDSVQYGRIILCALPLYALQIFFQSFFATAGKPNLGLFVTTCAGLTNVVLDAVLVIGLPQEYKLAGAAVATAASEITGGLIPLIYFARPNSSILRLGRTHFVLPAVWKAVTNGSSEFVGSVTMSFVSTVYNFQLLRYIGEAGVAAYGFMMYISMIFAAAYVGYSVGTAPITGFHDGAGDFAEVRSVFRKSLVIIAVLGVCMTCFAELSARPLAMIFVGYDEALLQLSVDGFRKFALSFLFMGFAIYGSSFFTALNDGLTSALISFLRTFVFETASVFVLPLLLGMSGIWYSIVVAEFMAMVMVAFFLWHKRKQVFAL
jgi:putative MATE family efflux protein